MNDYQRRLRRLAVYDIALLDELAVDGRAPPAVLDDRTAALLRIAAAVALDPARYFFQHAVAHALAAGATPDEIVASLEAVTPVTGAVRVVRCAPSVALALGYDVDAALEGATRDACPRSSRHPDARIACPADGRASH